MNKNVIRIKSHQNGKQLHDYYSTVTKLVLGHLIMWQAGFPTEKLQAKGEKAVENRLSET